MTRPPAAGLLRWTSTPGSGCSSAGWWTWTRVEGPVTGEGGQDSRRPDAGPADPPAIRASRVRGPPGHPLRGHRPVPGPGPVQRPDGVLAARDRPEGRDGPPAREGRLKPAGELRGLPGPDAAAD